MRVAEFFRDLFRRWIGLALVLLLALGAGAYGWKSTTVSYTSYGAVVVIPPGAGNPIPAMNPFINLNSNVAQLAFVLQTMAGSPLARATVVAAGGDFDYTMQTLTGNASSSASQHSAQISFAVTGSTPDRARAGATALGSYMRDALIELQRHSGVDITTSAADLQPSVPPSPGIASGGNHGRSALGYGGGVFIAGIMLLLVVTAMFQSVRRTYAGVSRSGAGPR